MPFGGRGEAIEKCWEDEDGRLWVSHTVVGGEYNYDYFSVVNFCPYCGYEAKVKAKIEDYEREN